MPKNTTQYPRPGLEPGPLDPNTGALTMKPPHVDLSNVDLSNVIIENKMWHLNNTSTYTNMKKHPSAEV